MRVSLAVTGASGTIRRSATTNTAGVAVFTLLAPLGARVYVVSASPFGDKVTHQVVITATITPRLLATAVVAPGKVTLSVTTSPVLAGATVVVSGGTALLQGVTNVAGRTTFTVRVRPGRHTFTVLLSVAGRVVRTTVTTSVR